MILVTTYPRKSAANLKGAKGNQKKRKNKTPGKASGASGKQIASEYALAHEL